MLNRRRFFQSTAAYALARTGTGHLRESPEPRSVIDVRQFGARGDGRSDDASAINAAIKAAADAGGAVVLCPAGIYATASSIALRGGVALAGHGMGRTIIRKLGDGYDTIVTANVRSLERLEYVAIHDLTIRGRFDLVPEEGGEQDRNLRCVNTSNVLLERVESLYSRNMGLTTFGCEYVSVQQCVARYTARDGINCTGARQARIIGNAVRYAGDDGIAAHFSSWTDELGEGAFGIIADNVVEHALAIKCLSANGFIISNNVSRRCRGSGIVIDGASSTTEGNVDVHNNIIIGNIVQDLFDLPDFGARGIALEVNEHDEVGQPLQFLSTPVGAGHVPVHAVPRAVRAGASIVVRRGGVPVGRVNVVRDAPKGSTSLAVSPTTFDLRNGDTSWILPEEQGIQSAPRGGAWNLIVAENLIAQKHAAGTAVPTGPLGRRSLALPARIEVGIFLQGTFHDLRVSGNIFSRNVAAVLPFGNTTLHGFIFAENSVLRCNKGVCLVGSGEHPGASSTVTVRGNHFDLDPFHESAQRAADGSWLGGLDAVPLWVERTRGVAFDGNTIRNASRVSHLDPTAQVSIGRNVLYTSTIGLVDGDPNAVEDIQDVGNPSIPEFGMVLFTKSHFSATPPIAGHWSSGERIWCRAPSNATRGWICTSTGAAFSAEWSPDEPVRAGVYLRSGERVYAALADGQSGHTAPTHVTGAGQTGGVRWLLVGPPASFVTF